LSEYKSDINQSLGFADQLAELAAISPASPATLVANCCVLVIGSNFNMTTAELYLDYGPLDFVKNLTLVSTLDWWQRALSFFNQPIAAETSVTCFGKQ